MFSLHVFVTVRTVSGMKSAVEAPTTHRHPKTIKGRTKYSFPNRTTNGAEMPANCEMTDVNECPDPRTTVGNISCSYNFLKPIFNQLNTFSEQRQQHCKFSMIRFT